MVYIFLIIPFKFKMAVTLSLINFNKPFQQGTNFQKVQKVVNHFETIFFFFFSESAISVLVWARQFFPLLFFSEKVTIEKDDFKKVWRNRFLEIRAKLKIIAILFEGKKSEARYFKHFMFEKVINSQDINSLATSFFQT